MFAVPPNTLSLPPAPNAVHPARLAAEIARDRARWAPLLRFAAHERFTTLVDAHPMFEVWLMSWLPGQHTDLHDHGEANGAFTVVSGTLTETVIRERPVTHLVRIGQTRVFAPGYTHQVRNADTEPSVSIHVYDPWRP